MAETLGSNADMTTNLDEWLDSMDAAPDKPGEMLRRLKDHYPLTTTNDLTTLLALFLRRVEPPA